MQTMMMMMMVVVVMIIIITFYYYYYYYCYYYLDRTCVETLRKPTLGHNKASNIWHRSTTVHYSKLVPSHSKTIAQNVVHAFSNLK